MTYRERREARAERLRGWAAKREANAAAVLAAGRPFTTDHAFNTQPGHIPFRARLIAREDRAHESLQKAASMESRADGIELQLARAIYEDDPDAEQALLARLRSLEAERDRIKAYNASCRKGKPDTSLLDDKQRADLLVTARVAAYSLGKGGAFPAYHLSNLGGRITTTRERLERMTREAMKE